MADDSKSDGIPLGVGATLALVVGALAAVGVTGDYIVRTVRDQPDAFSNIMRAALAGAALIAVGVTIGSFVSQSKGTGTATASETPPTTPSSPPATTPLPPANRPGANAGRALALVGALVVIVAAYFAVLVGTTSVHNPDQPRLVMSSATSENIVTINVDAKSSGLSPDDELLVQIIGIKTFSTKLADHTDLCENSQINLPADVSKGQLLAWERLGADGTGNVDGTIKVEAALGAFQGACAFGVLANTEKVETATEDARKATATYLRLNTAKAAAPPTTTRPTAAKAGCRR
jgi:hypothetical protein